MDAGRRGRRKVKVKSIIDDRCCKCHDDAGLQGQEEARRLRRLRRRAGGPAGRQDQPADEPGEADANHAPAPAQLLHAVDADRLIFAFSSYPTWLRCILAPLVLLAQVADVSCWWLARLRPAVGPYFALAIIGTGALVGVGLLLQIVLSLFNMYRLPGKMVLLLLFVGAVAAAACSSSRGRGRT